MKRIGDNKYFSTQHINNHCNKYLKVVQFFFFPHDPLSLYLPDLFIYVRLRKMIYKHVSNTLWQQTNSGREAL